MKSAKQVNKGILRFEIEKVLSVKDKTYIAINSVLRAFKIIITLISNVTIPNS